MAPPKKGDLTEEETELLQVISEGNAARQRPSHLKQNNSRLVVEEN